MGVCILKGNVRDVPESTNTMRIPWILNNGTCTSHACVWMLNLSAITLSVLVVVVGGGISDV